MLHGEAMIKTLLAITLACVLTSPVTAQTNASTTNATTWPTRPVTMVVPFPAGGPVDLVARLFAQRLSEKFGQQIIPENIGGAGGMSGAARVAQATPDGSVFLFGNQGTHTFSQMLYKRPLYNAVTDFAPVSVAITNAKILVTRKDFPADTLSEFAAYAKANQAKMLYGSAGSGSATQVSCILLNSALGIDVTHVPYRGTGPAMQDLIGGRIDYVCDVISVTAPLVEAKSVKAIALLSPQRSPAMPYLATAHEQGLKDFDTDGWNAFFFPKGVPDAMVQRFAKAVNEILETPAMRERLEGLGLGVPPPDRRGPEYLDRLVRSDLVKLAEPVKASGAVAE